jgi:hypothetical protein
MTFPYGVSSFFGTFVFLSLSVEAAHFEPAMRAVSLTIGVVTVVGSTASKAARVSMAS